jgi:bisphosphoglycerate-independent phosphoglycerate mutase (AlkP superfamily)
MRLSLVCPQILTLKQSLQEKKEPLENILNDEIKRFYALNRKWERIENENTDWRRTTD